MSQIPHVGSSGGGTPPPPALGENTSQWAVQVALQPTAARGQGGQARPAVPAPSAPQGSLPWLAVLVAACLSVVAMAARLLVRRSRLTAVATRGGPRTLGDVHRLADEEVDALLRAAGLEPRPATRKR